MPANGRSAYLHFLDRELGESVGYQATAAEVQRSLQLLTLVAGASLNCGTSLLFESPAINSSPSLFRFCQVLLSSGWLDLLSSHPTIAEFLESRAQLYEHDQSRYPMYFDSIPQIPSRANIISKSSSATRSLVRSLSAWGHDIEESNDRERDAKKVVIESLLRREDRAVTAAIFAAASAASAQPTRAISIVRRRISTDYTDHFMSVLSSDIATGMHGLDHFDHMSREYPRYDIQILHNFSRLLGINNIIESNWELNQEFWERFLYIGGADISFQAYLAEANILFSALSVLYKAGPPSNIPSFRTKIKQTLDQLKVYFPNDVVAINQDIFLNILQRTKIIISHLENNTEFRDAVTDARLGQKMSSSYDAMIMVATDVELNAVIEKFKLNGNQPTLYFDGGRAFYDLGYLNRRRIALVKTEMGSSSVGGSSSTALRMINHLSPNFIVMVGIAFGVDRNKQSIGEVLISKQVLCYDLQRVGTGADGEPVMKSRGDKTSADPTLVSLFQATGAVWSDASVTAGLLLSGDKLVDNRDFREQIRAFSGGEAIGGEMEGTGLIQACAETSTRWVIVKAICDWADGNKSHRKKERQELAAKNAVSFMFSALQVETGAGGAI